MTISVIIPLYNKANGIQRALDSVLAQNFRKFEIIIIDDGSNDGSVDIVQKYADPRINLIRQANSGVSSARNLGIQSARSNLIAFLDADDEWKPNMLETLSALFQRFPHAGAYATAYAIRDANGNIHIPSFCILPEQDGGGIVGNYFQVAMSCHPLWTSAVMIQRSVMSDVGGFPQDVSIGEDIDTWFRIALRYPIAWSPIPCATYHQSCDSACKNKYFVGDVAIARSFERTQTNSRIQEEQNNSIELLLGLYRLYDYMIFNWLAGETQLARHLLFRCSLKTLFWRRWALMFIVTCLPPSFSLVFLRVKGLISDQYSVLPPNARVYHS